ncbi:RNA polymerase RpoN-/SigL-like sigma 54 subunit [Prosthecobacter fusiformis]|uniref:RNA polymerase RpoN-/SigL-like sigma 54 subunit n=1 Tax=Prosthecobacter fusiformis TaxID=48464 RepID=A0A4R7RWH6_9BACT|nr:RNA polymerase factor sigma-54 [Prosthecobacter fusiformis]TDU69316.1 RNA polymerase RpoN-/SigL-like sigma 54 subunit [Prosthecobacter fusiformis]
MIQPALVQAPELSQHLSQELRIKLTVLQTPTHELDLLVRQELQQNPVLELENGLESTFETSLEDPVEDSWDTELSNMARMDDEWRPTPLKPAVSAETEERRQFMMESLTKPVTLAEHVESQLLGMRFDEEERGDIILLLGHLNDNGWLKKSLTEIAEEESRPVEDLAFAQEMLLTLDPPGLGASDLRHCLMTQLSRLGRSKSLEYHILDECFGLLSRRKLEDIASHFEVEIEDVQAAAERITTLNPRPAKELEEAPVSGFHVQPEMTIEKQDGRWVVVLHKDVTPSLKISHFYKNMMAEAEGKKDVREFIRDHIKRGRFFIDMLRQRHQTIQKVAEHIVARQEDFFETGPAHLKPMTMAEIATEVGVHESTVSRTVAGKYAITPHGMFELRSFFTSGMATYAGEAVSARAVEAALKDIVADEDRHHPLNDKEIAEHLAQRGIRISRRTVVKYRDRLGILPSALRRGL